MWWGWSEVGKFGYIWVWEKVEGLMLKPKLILWPPDAKS